MSPARRRAGSGSARAADASARLDRPLAWNSVLDWGVFGDEIVIFHPLSKQYFVLAGLAQAVWNLADGSRTANDLAASLARDHALSTEEVGETIAGLSEFGLFE